MDIQFILDPYASCSYVLEYVNKADRGMSESMEKICIREKESPNSTSFDTLRSLASTYYNSSEVSSQESAYNLLGIRMIGASTGTVFIPTSKPDKRTHVLKGKDALIKLQPNRLIVLYQD